MQADLNALKSLKELLPISNGGLIQHSAVIKMNKKKQQAANPL